MRNEILIVRKDTNLAESLRAAILAGGYVVPAIATSSHFAIEAAIEFKPIATIIDWNFKCDLACGELATALKKSLGIGVAFVSASPLPALRVPLPQCPWSRDAVVLAPPFDAELLAETLRALRASDAAAA